MPMGLEPFTPYLTARVQQVFETEANVTYTWVGFRIGLGFQWTYAGFYFDGGMSWPVAGEVDEIGPETTTFSFQVSWGLTVTLPVRNTD
jgi:hypothetical protein